MITWEVCFNNWWRTTNHQTNGDTSIEANTE